MAVYKGYEVDDALYSVIRYMPQIDQYREELERQQVLWDYLTVMAQLERLENDLGNASQQFSYLTGVLLNRLGLEFIKKAVNEYGFKAQVVINILVRNLFERTADIGFLATDENIRLFLSAAVEKNTAEKNNTTSLPQMQQALRLRFNEYVQKYSVYHDVILLSPEGRVLVRLDTDQSVTSSKDRLIKEALTTDAAYVEKFGYSDLLPQSPQSLIYAFRVTSADQQKVLGVVCLCFKFEDEMTSIFKNLVGDPLLETLLLLNDQHHVIASSGQDLIPLGVKIAFDPTKEFSMVSCKGRDYLCCAQPATPYQGYTGPGWVGCALLDLDQVFRQNQASDGFTFADKETLDSVMEGHLFDAATKSIPVLASQIEGELNRSVWNGNARQASERNGSDAMVSRVLLDEIKSTGAINKTIFEKAISDIQETVVSEVLRLGQSSAALAIDIMDRNLYERANDCRWWALDATLRTLLDQANLSAGDVNKMQSTLRYINSLYTVYTNLIVFDRQGKVIAVSNDQAPSLVGTVLEGSWVKSCLLHTDTAQYSVSSFEETPLYQHRPTYIYGAAIRSPDDKKVVGGIGIVFDAAPQFQQMLADVLTSEKNASGEQQDFAVFADQQHTIIASTHPSFVVGQPFHIGARLKPENGALTSSTLMKVDGRYYAAACAGSKGYREYKGDADAYQQEVYAYVMFDVGAIKSAAISTTSKRTPAENVLSTGGYKTQISSFYIGDDWFGVQSERVECAVRVDKVIPVHGNTLPEVLGYMLYKNASILLLNSAALLGVHDANARVAEAVIIRVRNKLIAMTIEALGDTLDVEQGLIQPLADGVPVTRKMVKNVVSTHHGNAGEKMLQLLDVELIAGEMKAVVDIGV